MVIEHIGNILEKLENKIRNEPFDAFKQQADDRLNKLKEALKDFETNDKMTSDKLHQNMSDIIKDALPTFDKSPSLFTAFKNALIHITNFFRRLVGASQIGLFRPNTHTALKETQQALDETMGLGESVQTQIS